MVHLLIGVVVLMLVSAHKSVVEAFFVARYRAAQSLSIHASTHPLTWLVPELSESMGGSGKAKIIWESLRRGVNPLEETLSDKAKDRLRSLLNGANVFPVDIESSVSSACGTKKLLVGLEVSAGTPPLLLLV